ncbi:hypothetical protein SASPL_119978 [Salvia splendens]|uniref:Pentatricopeptide repeat-containing protein n=1 Tax=Salvia splendens TaxID=180675 RepID=A0A8X8XTD7_SALSN|nr:hypothetical protein SASPL_119978 [Salvia splendens]
MAKPTNQQQELSLFKRLSALGNRDGEVDQGLPPIQTIPPHSRVVNLDLKRHGVKQALKFMEMVTSETVNNGWKPRRDTIDRFLECFNIESDVKRAEEFYELMKRINCVDTHFYEALLHIYAGAGQKLRNVRDGVEISTELDDLIASVSL